MRQKDRSSTEKEKPPKISKKQKKDGSVTLVALASMLILGGLLAIVHPIPFWSAGGTGRFGNHPVTSAYTTGQTIGFGVLFITIGLFLFRIAMEIRKSE